MGPCRKLPDSCRGGEVGVTREPKFRIGDKVRLILEPSVIRRGYDDAPPIYSYEPEFGWVGTVRGIDIRRSVTTHQDRTEIRYNVQFGATPITSSSYRAWSAKLVDELWVLGLDQWPERHAEVIERAARCVEMGVGGVRPQEVSG